MTAPTAPSLYHPLPKYPEPANSLTQLPFHYDDETKVKQMPLPHAHTLIFNWAHFLFNVVLVSVVQGREPAMCILASPPSGTPLPPTPRPPPHLSR